MSLFYSFAEWLYLIQFSSTIQLNPSCAKSVCGCASWQRERRFSARTRQRGGEELRRYAATPRICTDFKHVELN